MPTSLNLLNLFSNDPGGFGPTQTLDMTQPAFANTLSAYKTTQQQALIGFLSDIANSSVNKDEFYNRIIFSYLTTILEAGLTPDPTNWTQQVDAIRALIQTGIANDGLKVKYFTTTPTTNVGVSIFVEDQGYMHWDTATFSYKKDKLSVVSGSLKFYFDWDYSLLRYLVRGHGVINITTANVFQTLNYGVTLEESPAPVIAMTPIFGTAASVRTFLHGTPTATSFSLAASQVGFYDVSIFGEAI